MSIIESNAPSAATLQLGPLSNGMMVDPEEFDAAEFEPGWRYELLNGVLIVSPSPLRQERDPNEELGRLLRNFQETPQGAVLNLTLAEETISIGAQRRRVDRAIWCDLGRLPHDDEVPSIAVEFVSLGKPNRVRDYTIKRDEYHQAGVREYWIFDRFRKELTVFRFQGSAAQHTVFGEGAVYASPLLPGFELPLARLFELADRWDTVDDANADKD
ncbi:MAG: Uma2 family endonuclease [Planctomycetaceae bacterium]